MATYTVGYGESPASIAGKLYGNQRWAVEILRLNPDIKNWNNPGTIVVPDLEAVQNLEAQGFKPFISNELAQEMAGMGGGTAGTPSVTAVGQPAQGNLPKTTAGWFGGTNIAGLPAPTSNIAGLPGSNIATAPLGQLGGTPGQKPVKFQPSLFGTAVNPLLQPKTFEQTQPSSNLNLNPALSGAVSQAPGAAATGALAQVLVQAIPAIRQFGQQTPFETVERARAAQYTTSNVPKEPAPQAVAPGVGTTRIDALRQQIANRNFPPSISYADANELLAEESPATRRDIMENTGYTFDLTTKTWVMAGTGGLPQLSIMDGNAAAYQMGVLYHLWDVPSGYTSVTASLGGGASQTGRTDLAPTTYYAQVGNMIWNTGR